MQKLGKKVRRKASSMDMRMYCMCTNCGCTVYVNSTSSKYTNQKLQRD